MPRTEPRTPRLATPPCSHTWADFPLPDLDTASSMLRGCLEPRLGAGGSRWQSRHLCPAHGVQYCPPASQPPFLHKDPHLTSRRALRPAVRLLPLTRDITAPSPGRAHLSPVGLPSRINGGGLSLPITQGGFEGRGSSPSPYLREELPGREPTALPFADQTGPDALAAAFPERLGGFGRRRRRGRHRAGQDAGAEPRGPPGVVVRALGTRGSRPRFLPVAAACAALGNSVGNASRALAFWQPRERHGAPLDAPSLAAWKTQERPTGEDPEPGVRRGPRAGGGWSGRGCGRRRRAGSPACPGSGSASRRRRLAPLLPGGGAGRPFPPNGSRGRDARGRSPGESGLRGLLFWLEPPVGAR